MTDAVDEAIAATQQPSIEMTQLQGTMGSRGRPFVVAVPTDISDEEALALVSFVSSLPARQRAQRPASRILLPRPV